MGNPEMKLVALETSLPWERTSNNSASYGGFVAMIGGPQGRHLAEHEHSDLQLSVHFFRATPVNIIAPMQPHSGGWREGERVAVLLLSPTLLDEAIDDLSWRGTGLIHSQRCQDTFTFELAAAVTKELDSNLVLPNRQLYFEGIGYALAGHLVRTYAKISLRAAISGTLRSAQIARLAEYIDSSIAKPITVGDLATELGLGNRYFADAFKRTTQVTPYQYVLRRRIAIAKRLLRDKGFAIIEVALRVGFASQSHFTAAFSRHTGKSPARWLSENGG
jgi:AraC-like DNA-binding protein